jgi:hypothetical protein
VLNSFSLCHRSFYCFKHQSIAKKNQQIFQLFLKAIKHQIEKIFTDLSSFEQVK